MRRRDLLLWPVSVALAIMAGLFLLQANPGGVLRPCPLRTLTGIPCPTCGGTSAARSLLAADVGAAFRANPLVAATILLGIAGAVAALAILPWAGRLRPPKVLGRRTIGFTLLTIVLANWLYLILAAR
jgi:hypothetical protein